jgi:MoxR-like ATPase
LVTQELFSRLEEQWRKAIVGQENALRLLFLALVVRGHVLLEGVPGTAKTLIAKTLAKLVSGDFRRVQFTPDLMPSDVTGTMVFDLQSGRFHLKQGPVFTNVLLGDEINRAPAKTQAALLEAMEERQVTIDGEPHRLPDTFITLATQNPVEYEGTYPLPEAQLDRFLFKLKTPYMPAEIETDLLERHHKGFRAQDLDAAGLTPVVDRSGLEAAERESAAVTVDRVIMEYIVGIANASRRSPDLLLGVSPRASVALLLACRAAAALDGRPYVTPDDIKELAAPVLSHRLVVRPEAQLEGVSQDDAVRRVLGSVEVPR